jgi:hypothetical protein
MRPVGQQILLFYSATVSTVLAVVLLAGAGGRNNPRSFDRIQVHRIDVVESDGTLRMVISNKALLPPVIVRGREQPQMGEPRPYAGIIFYNDEGTENGGLVFGGHRNERGEVIDSGASLSFDRYGAGQIVQLAGVDDATDRFAGLAVNGNHRRRIWVGSDPSGTALLSLMDAEGRRRIVLQVTEDGKPGMQFLDEKGRVLQQFPPATHP